MDYNNYNKNNESETNVIEANYFSAYKGKPVLNYMEVLLEMDMIITMMSKKNIGFTGKMSLVKKIPLFIFSILMCALILTGCESKKLETSDIVAEYQVPFLSVGQKWNRVELIETDDMGRELYLYKSEGKYPNVFSDYMDESFTNAPVIAYIIVQKTDGDFVYCYNNASYEYAPSMGNENDGIIAELKQKNDWNKPLEAGKMTALPVDMESNGVSDYKLTPNEKQLIEKLQNKTGRKIEEYYLDCIFTADGTPMFVLREVKSWATNEMKNEFGVSFVFFEGKSDVEYLELSDNIQNWNEEITVFLKNTGDGSLC